MEPLPDRGGNDRPRPGRDPRRLRFNGAAPFRERKGQRYGSKQPILRHSRLQWSRPFREAEDKSSQPEHIVAGRRPLQWSRSLSRGGRTRCMMPAARAGGGSRFNGAAPDQRRKPGPLPAPAPPSPCFNGAAPFRERKTTAALAQTPAIDRYRLRFNGAAPDQRRKRDRLARARRRLHASMEPLPFESGRKLVVDHVRTSFSGAACFNGAAEGKIHGGGNVEPLDSEGSARLAGSASMEPLPFESGRGSQPLVLSDGTDVLLQWSRSLSRAEGRAARPRHQRRVVLQWSRSLSRAEGSSFPNKSRLLSRCNLVGRFNGAAPFRERKDTAAARGKRRCIELQWSRSLSRAEGYNRSIRGCPYALAAASMEPLPFESGRCDALAGWRNGRMMRCFNGAAPFREAETATRAVRGGMARSSFNGAAPDQRRKHRSTPHHARDRQAGFNGAAPDQRRKPSSSGCVSARRSGFNGAAP